MTEKIEIFFCYAQEDETFLHALAKQLSVLRRENKINTWHSQDISAGAEWRKEIARHLDAAHVILLLVSPDFLASDYCYSVELKRAMERHALGEAHVIPVILRSCHWQETPFGKLQALPARVQPVTAWSDRDEAFFNVAEGIRYEIEKLLALKQTRNIALFGYEMREGKSSPLWTNPSTFSLDEEYTPWLNTKREISRGELIGQTWVKTSNPEHTFIVHFFDGGFSEYALSDPARQWQGSWELLDGKLRMRVNKYELDILANRERLIYSGIEFAQDEQKPHSYFVCFPLLDTDARHWDLNEVPELVERIFDQILHQRVEKKLLITYGALLCRGEMTVRSLVKMLGLSRTYQERFINLKKPQETIELLYATFLGREAGAEGRRLYTKEIQAVGSNAIIADLIDSEEYQTRFGEDALPPRSAHASRAYWLKQLNLS
ncbi:MAG TPA: phycobilisome rod-core linker polypeptide [Ktedonobacteraceae bacterium]|nr:phycobilisome rod-core linker polypeptide [Ktedonobacteraceae bacterium]